MARVVGTVAAMSVRNIDDGPSRLLPASDREGMLAWASEQDTAVLIRVTAWSEVRLGWRIATPETIGGWLPEWLAEEVPDAVAVTLEVCGQLL
jgi:hypothetical protein